MLNIEIKSFALNFPSKQSRDKANTCKLRKALASISILKCLSAGGVGKSAPTQNKYLFENVTDGLGVLQFFKRVNISDKRPPVTFLPILNCKQEAGWNPDETSSAEPIKPPASHASACLCVLF